MKIESYYDCLPQGWKLPPKEIGGINIVRYFTLLFSDEIAGTYAFKTKNPEHPLGKKLKSFIQESDTIGEHLKQMGNNSLFVDYKYMRRRWLNTIDPEHSTEFSDIIMREFPMTMTAKQLVHHAGKIVETWWK